MISAKLLTDYRKALAEVTELARDAMTRAYRDLMAQGVAADVLRDGLIEAAWGATSDLGNLASVAAADFYEQIRRVDLPTTADYSAWLADLPDFDVIEQQGHMSARFLFDRKGPKGRVYKADPDVFLREFMVNVERLVLDAARDTIVQAGEHDPHPPRVAVIARPDACDYCQRAMSEGWLVSSRAARQGGIFHDNCRCFPAPSWEFMPEIEGVRSLPVPAERDPNPF